MSLTPAESGWAADCELQAADGDGPFRRVRSFRFDRSNMEVNVGPLPHGPVAVAFAPVTAKRFRLLFTGISGKAALAEVDLSPAARIESFIEKQLGTLWIAPWRVDITAAVRPGGNLLEIEVVNPWNNRLVGDANLPPEKRRTFLAAPTVTKETPLLEAGLLGPVTIQVREILTLGSR